MTGARSIARVETIQRLWSGYGEILRVHFHDGARRSVIVKVVLPPAPSAEDLGSHARKLRSYASGWAPEQYARTGYSARMSRLALAR